jgi:hypothetical protein
LRDGEPALGLLAGAALMTAATGRGRRRNPRRVRDARPKRRFLLVRRQDGMDDAAKTLGVKPSISA